MRDVETIKDEEMTSKVEQATELMKHYNEMSVQYEEICKKIIEEEKRIRNNLRNFVQKMDNSEKLEFYNSIEVTSMLKFDILLHLRELKLI